MRARVWMITAVMTLGACGGSTDPTPDPTGVYTLVSLNGHALPAPATAWNDAVTAIEDATLTLAGTPGRLRYCVTMLGVPPNGGRQCSGVDIGWGGNPDGSVAVNVIANGGVIFQHTGTLHHDTLTVTLGRTVLNLPEGTYAFVKTD